MKVQVRKKGDLDFTEIRTTVISQPTLEKVIELFLSKDVEKINELEKFLNK